jgi:hypothetical protein
MACKTTSQDKRSHRPRPRTVLGLLPGLLLCAACATPTAEEGARSWTPSGPGVVYPSVQEASVDALAWSHLESTRVLNRGRTQGGAIHAVSGGFSYDAPEIASENQPDVVRYQLSSRDVAHFRLNSATGSPKTNRRREKFTRLDRSTVNELDPIHRPLYILTPNLVIRAYHGSSVGAHDVAHLDSRKSFGSSAVYLVKLD